MLRQIRRRAVTRTRQYASQASAAAATTTSVRAHQGSGFANVTSLLHFRDRLEVSGHHRPVGIRNPLAAATAQAIGVPRREPCRRHGFELFERKVDILAKRLPAAEILLEPFVTRRGSTEFVLFRRSEEHTSELQSPC